MRPDPGRAMQESLIAAMSPPRRSMIGVDLRRRGLEMAWRQVDRASLTNPVAQADFLLRRLYPEMPEQWFAEVLRQLRAKHEAGEWHGFERPRS